MPCGLGIVTPPGYFLPGTVHDGVEEHEVDVAEHPLRVVDVAGFYVCLDAAKVHRSVHHVPAHVTVSS